ncbi:hypothetical protein CGCFRS4_v015522 [Colletotrichum fructicola]|nr:hypothetical protein CGCFRS4_v015522 [Colletotrichum fructicola]
MEQMGTKSKKDKKKKKKQKASEHATIATINGPETNETPLVGVEVNRTPVAADSSVFGNGLESAQISEAETRSPALTCEQIQTDEPVSTAPTVKFVVSSRHLSLSSRYFKKALSELWAKTLVHSEDGRRHLQAADWDADALLILMQIFHARTKNIPRSVDLEQLAKIAVLVDYYKCHDTVKFFATLWIDSLQEQLPSQCNRELVLWLFVSVVFRRDDIFQAITKTAVTESKGPLPTLGLSIPERLISLYAQCQLCVRSLILADRIDFRRQDGVAGILRTLDALSSSLCRGDTGCDFECSSALFGALAKNKAKHNLTDPVPCAPFLGCGINALEKAVTDFQTPRWDTFASHRSGSGNCELSGICLRHLETGLNQVKKGFTLSKLGLLRL